MQVSELLRYKQATCHSPAFQTVSASVFLPTFANAGVEAAQTEPGNLPMPASQTVSASQTAPVSHVQHAPAASQTVPASQTAPVSHVQHAPAVPELGRRKHAALEQLRDAGEQGNEARSWVANNHATKDGYTRAIGWSCECTGLAIFHVAAKLLLVLLNSAGLAAARRE
eukprot:1159235-Pelagomonas_calceolata.AAC.25